METGRALPRSPAMNPVVAKMPVPTMFEITSAVAPTNPICRSNPGLDLVSEGAVMS